MVERKRGILTVISIVVFAALAAATGDRGPENGSAPPRDTHRSALAVCRSFESQGVATNCLLRTDRAPGGGWELAAESALFDLPAVPGHKGEVATFDTYDRYRKTLDVFAAHADTAGPYRFGVRKALVFTQINRGLSAADAEKVTHVLRELAGDQIEQGGEANSDNQTHEDPKWQRLRDEFGHMKTAGLLARARTAIAVDPPTADSVREADMALAFLPDADSKRADVRKLQRLVNQKGREMIENDPEKRAEMERTVREVMAHQLERGFADEFESVSDDEATGGPVLRIHGPACSQQVVNDLALREAKFELRKAGWQRIVCHKSMLTWYEANLR